MNALYTFYSVRETATTEIYTLSLHDALPILAERSEPRAAIRLSRSLFNVSSSGRDAGFAGDRKSTRLNSSHQIISYAVFCLKKKTMRFISYVPMEPPGCTGRRDHYSGKPCGS